MFASMLQLSSEAVPEAQDSEREREGLRERERERERVRGLGEKGGK